MKNPYKTTILKAVQGNYRPCSKCADYSDYSEIPKTKPSANSSTNRKEQTATPIHRFTFIFGLTLAGVFKYRHNKKIEQYEREKQNEL